MASSCQSYVGAGNTAPALALHVKILDWVQNQAHTPRHYVGICACMGRSYRQWQKCKYCFFNVIFFIIYPNHCLVHDVIERERHPYFRPTFLSLTAHMSFLLQVPAGDIVFSDFFSHDIRIWVRQSIIRRVLETI